MTITEQYIHEQFANVICSGKRCSYFMASHKIYGGNLNGYELIIKRIVLKCWSSSTTDEDPALSLFTRLPLDKD